MPYAPFRSLTVSDVSSTAKRQSSDLHFYFRLLVLPARIPHSTWFVKRKLTFFCFSTTIPPDHSESQGDDDINTADAISVIFEIVADANKQITAQSGTAKALIQKVIATIEELGGVLGLLTKKEDAIPQEVEELLAARKEARATKNWAESDRLRDCLKELGYAVKDTPQGQQLTKL